MRIDRCGTERYRGWKGVEIEDPAIACPDGSEITIEKKSIRDFTGRANHDYVIRISLKELAKILEVVAEVPAVEHPTEVARGLRTATRALLRLTTIAAGGNVAASPDDEDEELTNIV